MPNLYLDGRKLDAAVNEQDIAEIQRDTKESLGKPIMDALVALRTGAPQETVVSPLPHQARAA